MNNNFEEIFIEHCAPLFTGIKISNLFYVKFNTRKIGKYENFIDNKV